MASCRVQSIAEDKMVIAQEETTMNSAIKTKRALLKSCPMDMAVGGLTAVLCLCEREKFKERS